MGSPIGVYALNAALHTYVAQHAPWSWSSKWGCAHLLICSSSTASCATLLITCGMWQPHSKQPTKTQQPSRVAWTCPRTPWPRLLLSNRDCRVLLEGHMQQQRGGCSRGRQLGGGLARGARERAREVRGSRLGAMGRAVVPQIPKAPAAAAAFLTGRLMVTPDQHIGAPHRSDPQEPHIPVSHLPRAARLMVTPDQHIGAPRRSYPHQVAQHLAARPPRPDPHHVKITGSL